VHERRLAARQRAMQVRAVPIAVLVAVVGIAAYALGTMRDDPPAIERLTAGVRTG
jgi:hypothetical protein